MAIDETGLTKGLVRKLNTLRKSVGGRARRRGFRKVAGARGGLTSKRQPRSRGVKIAEVLAGFENDPKFNLGNYGYTLRRAKGKGASGFIAYKNEKPKETLAPSSEIELEPPSQEGTAAMSEPSAA